MSATVLTPARSWARTHRAVLAIIVLSVALAVSVALLAVRTATGSASVPAPAPTVSVPHGGPLDNGCQMVRPGQPC